MSYVVGFITLVIVVSLAFAYEARREVVNENRSRFATHKQRVRHDP